MKKIKSYLAIMVCCSLCFISCKDKSSDKSTWPVVKLPDNADTSSAYWKGIDLEPKPPVLPLSVKDQQAKFIVPPGYKLEAVLTEPKIQQPAAISFDGNGRMYVLELRSYMLDADSKNTLTAISGISRWEDKNNDGVYESGGMFVDSLVFPRFVLPYGPNTVLTMESNADVIYKYTDTNNDGKADKKEFFTDNFGRAGNVEHQQAFLYWGMDNWLYSTVNPFRIRETPMGVIRESTASNHAQWGISHDDDGKLWFQGGSNGVPSYFQFPVHYGDYVIGNKINFADGFQVPYGAPIKLADVQPGMPAVRQPDGSLNQVTGASGNDVYRGDRLPKELYGEYFYGEPVARIVRHIHADVKDGLTTLHNVYQKDSAEFIRSMDPLFRPVDMATAPDGTMYIVDMYHGIIQEGEWTPAGSYLRVKIEQYQLDKVINMGRIWRLTHESNKRDQVQPRMYEESSADLVKHLSHANGWWRDMAQQILVQRKDTTVKAALIDVVHTNSKIEAKFHALWALEGIGKLESATVHTLLQDANPRMRRMALWLSESLYKAGDKSFEKIYLDMMANEKDVDTRIRAFQTGRLLKINGTVDKAKAMIKADTSIAGLKIVGRQVIDPIQVNAFFGRSNPNFSDEEKKLVEQGGKIYGSLCATCHGTLGNGIPSANGKLLAPSFIANKRVKAHPDYVIKTLLHGLVGEIQKESFTGVLMTPMGKNTDEYIAAVASYIRTNFENNASLVSKEDVKKVREATKDQVGMYKFDALWATIPKELDVNSNWKITASHTGQIRKGSTASPFGATTFEGWTTGTTQKAGMWYQIELPTATKLTQMQFKSQAINRRFRAQGPPPIQTCPGEFDLEVSLDGQSWKKVIEKDTCTGTNTIIKFDPVEAKFLKMTLTKDQQIIKGERQGRPFDFEVNWTMRELKVFGL